MDLRLYMPLVYVKISIATANPIHSQSHPFRGKTIAYINMVQGKKTKPAMPTSQGKLKLLKAAFTRTGAISQ